MANITAIVLTKNEEKNIVKCINNLKRFCKDILIIDSYSTDKTLELCEKLKVKVVQRKFIDHSEQFNWALENSNINTEWIIRVDADEEFTDELINEIKEKIDNIPNNVSGIVLKARVYFMGKWIKHGGIYPLHLLRLFRTGSAYSEKREMDEHIVVKYGEIIKFNNDFINNSNNTLTQWIDKHNWYSNKELKAYLNRNNDLSTLADKQNMKRRWLKNKVFYKIPLFTRAKLYYLYRYYIKLGFLDGQEGKIFHFLQAYWYRFLVDSKIYEKKVKN
ncbi:glycosyltransferase family 2 protein [Clostridium tarantellae]|uniref:Glycosyltransferase n=1 Tax=Clostridium tarantellae TaxID=39493 RepID=A0A6I1MMQ9_9CLOT|nr:glycosyltransferase family 2 protein [Clostridium tarantellae]MPQ43417.1 glycosyltransferase [Clostridium tarantellae]